jgi:hypothetical protein
MNTHSSTKSYSPPDVSGFRPFVDRSLDLLRRALVAGFLVSFIWLSGLSINPALAMPIANAMPEGINLQSFNSAVGDDQTSDLIACLPNQLSQPNLKRALSEMGNNQLERAFNLKTNPKLSQAEIDLASCLNRQKS